MIFGFGRSKAALVIRPAQMSDARDVASIHAASFDQPWGLMEFERMMAEANTLAHVAGGERDSDAFVLSRLSADEAEILSIAVHPRRRGEGLSGRLLSAHTEALALNRVRTIFLEVESANQPALALYKRQGFAEVARRNAYYRKADGSAATALVMRRVL
ncbi:MAG: ribosomal protein S18-alanine N-acetyltransferase [Methylocystis sp.]|jgi:ribosomal-protein-alanine N-acetyltransferase|nr:ribosomal protein S18-alanine N-acetyltransferase [Methylocystis sp.]MCA3582185.1 ribosomal protein S18-alanine N-acetyltransferase [Methylocystis sp.]MCA3587923.1 ribosomal protein S18-alanine N-acetyltransferase [Methylocystis sp.]MCA3590246.1 ribosomal protein S18-alanine N-acetyltransferase [Methylocystis sp.]